MKRPLKKEFSKPFSLNSNFVCYDSKQHAKALSEYIDYLEKTNAELLETLIWCSKKLNEKDSIGLDDIDNKMNEAIKKATS